MKKSKCVDFRYKRVLSLFFLKFLLFFIHLNPIYAQQKTTQAHKAIIERYAKATTFTTKLKLPSNQVYDIHQDQRGYIWIATDRGLLRYNGVEFKNYNSTGEIDATSVFKIYESDSSLWFQTNSNVVYNYQHGIIKQSKTGFENESICRIRLVAPITKDSVKLIYHSPKAKYYIQAFTNIKTGKSQIDTFKINANSSFNIHFDTITNKFSGSTFLSKKIDEDSIEVLGINILQKYFRIHGIKHEKSSIVGFGNILIFKKDGLIINKFKLNGAIECINYLKSLDIIAVGTVNNGLYLFDKNGHTTINCLSNLSITKIFEDATNNIWISTLNNGISFLPAIIFQEHSVTKQTTLLNTANDAIYYMKDSFLVELLDLNKKNYYFIDKAFLNSKSISHINHINNTFYISTNRGVFKGFIKNDSLIIKPTIINGPSTKAIPINNELFIIRYAGVFLFNDSAKVFESTKIHKQFRGQDFVNLTNDSFLIATDKGLKYFYRKDLELEDYHIDSKLRNTSITSIAKYNDLLLIGTLGKGVFLFKNKKTIMQLDANHHLNSNMISDVELLDENKMLIATNSGLYYCKILDGKVIPIRISVANGISSNDVRKISFNDKTLCISNQNEIECIELTYLDSLSDKTSKIIIEEILTNDSTYYFPNEISSYFKNLTIKFCIINDYPFSNNTYLYRINSENSKWTGINSNTINFSNLSNGIHILEIKKKGDENSIYSITLNQNIPFYYTIAFKILLIITLSISIILLSYLRFKSLNLVLVQKAELLKSEHNALRAQMNPHFLFNAMNTIQAYVSSNDKNRAYQFISKFSSLVRAYLKNSQHKFVSLQDELESIYDYLYLEQMRFNMSFDYQIELSKDVESNKKNLFIPSMVLQPLVENAILHGIRTVNNGKIDIQINLIGKIIVIDIIDNGIGLSASKILNENKKKYHKSIGINNLMKRISLLNDLYKSNISFEIIELFDDKNKVIGTKVIFKTPTDTI